MPANILHIDASARLSGSVTRTLSAKIVDRLGGTVTRRDLADPLPLIDDAWLAANWSDPAARTDADAQTLALSDRLIAELRAADTIVIGAPVYNFGVPAALKAWIDLIARAGQTFRYTDTGPVGLLDGKRAIVAMASGGTKIGSEIDFASGYLRHVLGFVGITDVQFVTADQVGVNPDQAISGAEEQLQRLAA